LKHLVSSKEQTIKFLLNRTENLLLIVIVVFPHLSCTSEQTTTPNPASAVLIASPTVMTTTLPFERYGEMVTDVAYCNTDPAQKMDIYFPQSGGPWPTVVYIHGGGWMHGDKSEAALFASGMNSMGFLVVSLNYRLYPPATFPAMIEDVKCGIRSLRAHAGEYNLDPNRIAAMGASAGGHLVSLLGTTDQSAGWDIGEYLDQSSRVQAVISLAAVMDLSQTFPNADGNDVETMKRIGFNESNMLEASPVTHVSLNDPPFLLIHGDHDELVPYQQSQLMYDRLVQANVPAQLVIVKNASHSFDAPNGDITPSLAELNFTILEFLTKYLG
jgi:acetyl esterase/lipase